MIAGSASGAISKAFRTMCALLACLLAVFAGPGTVYGDEPGGLVKVKVDLERSVLPAGARQKSVVKVSVEALRPEKSAKRPSLNLAIALDRSGSMQGAKIQRAKEGVLEALNRLGEDDIFSLVIYNQGVHTVAPAQDLENISIIKDQVRRIRPGGKTALYAGVNQAAAEIRKNMDGGRINRILLLSDGLANVGPSSPEDLGRLGEALANEEISVSTIGVGTDYNEDLMTRLSMKSDGNSYFVEKAVDLPDIFKAELGDALTVVAKNVDIKIICPDGVKPVRTIGTEAKVDGQEVGLSMNNLYGGQERSILLEVEVPKGAHGQKRKVASAQVKYEDVMTRKSGEAEAKAAINYSKDENAVKASLNVDVSRDIQIMKSAEAQSEAVELADKGNTKAAVEKLNESRRNLRKYGKDYDDAELKQRAEAIERQAEDLQNQGFTKRNRKRLKTDAYQYKRQQKTKLSY